MDINKVSTSYNNKVEDYYLKKLDEERKKARELQEFTQQIMENRKKEADALTEELMKAKKKNIETMIKTLRMLPSRNYTKESWNKAMIEVEKAMKYYTVKDVSSSQLDKALNHLRIAMGKLTPALKDEERGRESDTNKAFKKLDEKLLREANNAPEIGDIIESINSFEV